MASRATAADRMRRVLAVVPWIVANPGRRVTEVAERFGLAESELLADLNVVFLVGLPPYSPDALVDVQIDDEGRVSIQLADFFSRPLRLSPEQGLALLASSDALLSIPGTDPGGALARALDKLGAALGVGPDDALDVHLGQAEGPVLDQLRDAAARRMEAEISYYSYGRDERNRRVVEPWRVFADQGAWYLQGWCQLADGERVFRVDRIEDLAVTDRPSLERPAAASAGNGVFQPGADDPRVVLRLAPAAAWVADAYPVTVVSEEPSGALLVELVISAIPWLERLLIRLGPDVDLVDHQGIERAEELAASAATRILARYRGDHRPPSSDT